jgi:hypothetical protein
MPNLFAKIKTISVRLMILPKFAVFRIPGVQQNLPGLEIFR